MLTRSHTISTVIFDWTGVLMNEFEAVYTAHAQTIVDFDGQPGTYEHFLESIRADWRHYYRACGVDPHVLHRAFPRFREHLEKNLDLIRPYEGGAAMLRELAGRGLQLAVVSGQARRAVLYAAKKFDLLRYFALIIGAEDALEAKPSAEPLRLVLRTLKTHPTQALYVEDMEEGIRAGREVGVVTVGVRSELPQDLSRADLTIDRIDNLPHLLNHGALAEPLHRDPALATTEQRTYLDTRYQQKLRGRVSRIISWYHADNLALAKQISRWGVVERSSRVADIGCGLSAYLEALVDEIGCRGVSLDLSLVAVDAARTRRDGAPMQFAVADVAAVPFLDGTFDTIICSETLEHVSDETTALKEIARVLRPGGAFIVSVPNTARGTFRVFRSLQMEFNLAGHVREFEEAELRDKLDAAGFEIVRLHTSSYWFYWLAFSIDRSGFAKWWIRFFERHPTMERLVKRALFTGITAENAALRRLSGGGMCRVVLARKHEATAG